MRGSQHLVSGIAITSLAYGTLSTDFVQGVPFVNVVADKILLYFDAGSFESFGLTGKIAEIEGALPLSLLSLVLLCLGLLLPDIDLQTSTLGKFLYLPIEHRTWTHSVWFLFPFILGGIFLKPVMWIAIGIFLHLLCDSFSRCGVCWFYPISHYKYFGGEGKIKNRHFLYLYSGDVTGWIVTGIIVAGAVAFMVTHLGLYWN